ncbi:transcriptional regulator domain-containing protein [Hoeflea poritis]|uniref:transcriptional regulator domain-containing protein n=1 Tax=Hoeflea poritis TaxID=2993659 RepID=UPI003CCC8F9C
MMTGERSAFTPADWCNAQAYVYTLRLTRLGWAWEFLRRNQEFRVNLARVIGSSAQIESHFADARFRSEMDLSRWGVLFRGLAGSRCSRFLVAF